MLRLNFTIVCFLTCLFLTISCIVSKEGGKAASTSVTTGNPTGIKLSLTKDGRTTSITGRMEIYGSTQIPVMGFSPKPLATFPLENSSAAFLEASDLNSIPDSSWPYGSMGGDSIYRFNIALMSDSIASVTKGFGFDKKHGHLIPRMEERAVKIEMHRIQAVASFSELLNFQWQISANRINPNNAYYVFDYGTGFAAMGIPGENAEDPITFSFRSILESAKGAYLIPLPSKEHNASINDSAAIYTLAPPLNSHLGTLAIGDVFEKRELPDSLKSK